MAAALRLSPHLALEQARAWGWPLIVGAVALALACGIALGVVPALRREAQAVALQADAAMRRNVLSGAARQDARAAGSAPERFLAGFPSADERQARVGALLELASHHALEVRVGEFQLSQDKASGLTRYSVTLPLTGTYPQLRAFMEDALGSDAALSLDRLRLRRASAGAAALESETTWSFYMRARAAPASAGVR